MVNNGLVHVPTFAVLATREQMHATELGVQNCFRSEKKQSSVLLMVPFRVAFDTKGQFY